jgi:hypothetical protein
LVIKRLDDERPSLHAIGIATDHARVGTLARNFAGFLPVQSHEQAGRLGGVKLFGHVSLRVASLTDDVLKFSHDGTRPMGFPGDLKRG